MSRLLIRTPSQTQAVVDNLYSNMERRIAASPPGLCPVDMALNFLTLCHAQSCGKCTPCRVGLGKLTSLMRNVLDGEATIETLDTIKRTAAAIVDSSDCAIGTNAARLVLEGIKGFEDDYISHITKHHCLGSLQNPVPCVALCPAGVDIPGYIALISSGRNEDAVKLIRKDNPFPVACGYICEHPCEARCRRSMVDNPINIRGLKKFAVDNTENVPNPPCASSTGKTVAVIGGGPGGLSAAYYLTLMGHKVTVYEAHKKLGGMLRYGIPAYRFPREKLDADINNILSIGVTVHTGIEVGKDITFEQLKEDYDCLYIAIGAQTDKKIGLEGEDLNGVISAVEMLGNIGDDIMPDFTGKRIIVIGGGNVAMDVTRSALRLGAEKVSCVYRRRQEDMTALSEEIEGALAEGVELLTLQAPLKIESDEKGNAVALWTKPQVIGNIDKSYRPRPQNAELEANRIEGDVIIMAVGQGVQSNGFEQHGITICRGGTIEAQEDSRIPAGEGIFAGGDCVTGPATAIRAIAAGKVAAANIDEYLGFHHVITTDVEVPMPRFNNQPPHGRVNIKEREAGERKKDFSCIECEMTCQEAKLESSRCLRCDYFGYGNFKGGRREVW